MLGKNPTHSVISLVLFLFFVTETKLSRLALNLQCPGQITGLGNNPSNTEYLKRATVLCVRSTLTVNYQTLLLIIIFANIALNK